MHYAIVPQKYTLDMGQAKNLIQTYVKRVEDHPNRIHMHEILLSRFTKVRQDSLVIILSTLFTRKVT